MTTDLTFRVSCIPAEIPDYDLASFLVKVIPALVTTDNIRVGSRAPSLEDFSRRRSSVATVLIKNVPLCFRDGSDRWSFPVVGQVNDLIVDKHFEGFTPLNDVSYHHEFDCIAISGLASHPYGSWRCRQGLRPGTDFMWLRDQLSKDRPSFRVMCYGYNSMLIGSNSFQTIDHLALNFARQLVDMRVTNSSRKPIIFLAHSLGGIVLKGALAYLASGSDIYKSTIEATKVVVLFGVPNTGMHTSHLRAMTKAQPNDQMVKDLAYGSSYLKSLDERFSNHSKLRGIKLVAAFETMTSATAVKTEGGKWIREGPREVLVPEASATAIMGSQLPHRFPINEDHSNMVKFFPSEVAYKSVLAAITQTDEESTKSARQKSIDTSNSSAPQASGDIRPASMGFEQRINYLDIHTYESFSSGQWLDVYQQNAAKLRDSLHFEEMKFREEGITDAQDDTFSWITQDESLGFTTWLQSHHGLYWIRGKPGSGKSTLMKFIQKDRNINDMLSWGFSGYQSIVVWFFFHERGSVLQKSYEGLLRSILTTIVDRNEELAVEILKVFILKAPWSQWSINKLENALDMIRKQDNIRIRITMFLDALDEYYGAPESIANILKTFQQQDTSSTVDTKICFSSRPWDAFIKNFDKEPGFTIHDQTTNDVRKYVERRLTESPKVWQKGLAHSQRAYGQESATSSGQSLPPKSIEIFSASSYDKVQDFVNTIIRRAEGVFLWLRLVIDSVQATVAQQSTCTIDDLFDLLSQLPDDLETYYRRSIERMPIGDREKAHVLLEILYRSSNMLSVEELFYTSICARQSTFHDSMTRLREAIRVHMSEDQMSQRLLNLCGGLIEVKKSYSTHATTQHQPILMVQFIHQTAREFFAKPSSIKVFLGSASGFRLSREDGNTHLAKFWLTNNALLGESPIMKSHDHAKIYARRSEFTTGTHLGTFIESIDYKAFEEYSERKQPLPLPIWRVDGLPSLHVSNSCDSPKTFGVYADLRLYLQSSLDGNWKSLDRLTPPDQMPLLHCAIINLLMYSSKRDMICYTFGIDAHDDGDHMLSLVKLLIDGTSPKTTYQGHTAMQILVHQLLSDSFSTVSIHEFFMLDGTLDSILSMFLTAGYCPDLEISLARNGLGSQQEVCKTTLLHLTPTLAPPLVKAGVKVNSFDSQGRTPLDHWMKVLPEFVSPSEEFDRRRLGTRIDRQLDNLEDRRLDNLKTAISIVAQHGGMLTSKGASLRQSCLKRLISLDNSTNDVRTELIKIPVMPASRRFKTSLRNLLPGRKH